MPIKAEQEKMCPQYHKVWKFNVTQLLESLWLIGLKNTQFGPTHYKRRSHFALLFRPIRMVCHDFLVMTNDNDVGDWSTGCFGQEEGWRGHTFISQEFSVIICCLRPPALPLISFLFLLFLCFSFLTSAWTLNFPMKFTSSHVAEDHP